MTRRPAQPRPVAADPRERGVVLIVVMIVVFALASMALVLGKSMRVEATATVNQVAGQQAAAIARGAEQYVLALLAEGTEAVAGLDESSFREVAVGEGFFWVLRPDYGDTSMPTYGLVDESAKIDLNTATADEMVRLAGMTDEIAGAIVDWRDADDEVTGSGAETPAYASGVEGYRAKNSAFETVEELLMVRGMSRPLLYGPAEAPPLGDFAGAEPSDRTTQVFEARGLFDFFTAWAAPGAAATGTGTGTGTGTQAALDINSQRNEVRQLLRDTLGSRGTELAARVRGRPYLDVFDFATQLGLTAAEFEQIEGRIARAVQGPQPWRVNINAAPREVLMCLGTLTEADADTLIAQRPSPTEAGDASVAWVLDVLKEKAVGLGGRLVSRGTAFSADILAVAPNGRGFKRVRIVVDTSGTTPRIVYRRDRTDAGWPLAPEALDALRRGESLAGGGAGLASARTMGGER